MTEIEQKKATKIAMSAGGRWGVELLLPTTFTFFLPVTGVRIVRSGVKRTTIFAPAAATCG